MLVDLFKFNFKLNLCILKNGLVNFLVNEECELKWEEKRESIFYKLTCALAIESVCLHWLNCMFVCLDGPMTIEMYCNIRQKAMQRNGSFRRNVSVARLTFDTLELACQSRSPYRRDRYVLTSLIIINIYICHILVFRMPIYTHIPSEMPIEMLAMQDKAMTMKWEGRGHQ